jgi:hypothetical protein
MILALRLVRHSDLVMLPSRDFAISPCLGILMSYHSTMTMSRRYDVALLQGFDASMPHIRGTVMFCRPDGVPF